MNTDSLAAESMEKGEVRKMVNRRLRAYVLS